MMGGDSVDKMAKRAAKRAGFKRTRRNAARHLAELRTPEAAAGLALAAADSGDEAVVELARRTFAEVNDQEVIDAICNVWWTRTATPLAADAPGFDRLVELAGACADEPAYKAFDSESLLLRRPRLRVPGGLAGREARGGGFQRRRGAAVAPAIGRTRGRAGRTTPVAWLDLAEALAGWRHRHDVEVGDAAVLPGVGDIELDEQL
jgi:hypothetical protein